MKVLLCEDTDWLLSEEAFLIYAPCMFHPTYEKYKTKMEDCLTDSSVKVFVIEYQGRKTGMMVLNLSEADAEIIGIAVSANARRKGIGKQMIQRVMESENLESVKAQTDDDSIGFYRKCGFSEERTGIEYDGQRYHQDVERDKKKDALCLENKISQSFYQILVAVLRLVVLSGQKVESDTF